MAYTKRTRSIDEIATMYDEMSFAADNEDPIWDESSPKIVFIISLFSLVLLAISLFIPWISLAPIEVREANMHIFQDWVQTLQADNPNIKEYIDQIRTNTEIDLRLEPIIDKQGLEKLRMTLETVPSINGFRLLRIPETAVWVKMLFFLEMSLVAFTLLWFIASVTRIEAAVKRIFAGIILVVSSVSLILVIGLQPTIETLGFRNKFGLVLLLTIFEAKPGVGIWFCMLANICLGVTFLFYLAANDMFSDRSDEIEQNDWY